MTYGFLDPQLAAWKKTPEGSRTLDDKFMDTYLTPLLYEPGESWTYSVSLDWAGKLVERANGGVTLEAYMQQHIWDPLGIQDMTFYLEKKERLKQNLVEMSTRVPESGLLIPDAINFLPDSMRVGSGGAGLYATASEYLKVLTSILRDDGKLVTSATVAEMFKAQISPASQATWLKILENPLANAAMTGNTATTTEFTWGIGGKLSIQDMPDGRRKKGSLSWGGIPNLYWVSQSISVSMFQTKCADWGHFGSGSIPLGQGWPAFMPVRYCR